jgi:hypothetical protein
MLGVVARLGYRPLIRLLALTCLAVVIGVSIAVGAFLLLAVCLAVVLAALATVGHWRWAIFGLLLFLPFDALPGLLLRESGWPALIKDAIFLAPGYLGVALSVTTRQERIEWRLSPALVFGLVGFCSIVLFQTAHEIGASPAIAAIGLKTWLLYLPLVLVGQQLFRSVGQLRRSLRILLLIALVPAVVGIAEAILVYTGHSSVVNDLYGSLASDVTQGFATVGLGSDLTVKRIPSTFTFVTQYYLFLLAMVPVACTIWLSDNDRRWRLFGGFAVALIALAGVSSGARGFLVWFPIELGLILALSGNRARRMLVWIYGTAGVLIVMLSSLLSGVAQFLISLATDYLFGVSIREISAAIGSAGLLGAGAGTQTGAIRYVQGPSVGVGVEGWYAKVLYELGLPGLIFVLFLFSVVLVALWSARQQLRFEPLGVLSGAILAASLTTMVNIVKGPYVDLDPLSVYFWFFIGLGLALPRLATDSVLDGKGPYPSIAVDAPRVRGRRRRGWSPHSTEGAWSTGTGSYRRLSPP